MTICACQHHPVRCPNEVVGHVYCHPCRLLCEGAK
jgi:hypothetical protein